MLLYAMSKSSYRTIGHILDIDHSLAYRWIRDFGETPPKSKVFDNITQMEFNEMLQFIGSNKTNFDTSKPLTVAHGELWQGCLATIILQPSNVSAPKIALTFDDGPSSDTNRILDILNENNSKATFFLLGSLISSNTNYAQIAKRALSKGCEVLGHSWKHDQFQDFTEEELEQDLQKTNNALFEVLGIHTDKYRTPYGQITDTIKKVSKKLGLSIIMWTFDPRDFESLNADVVYNDIMTNAHEGAIILCHELPSTAEAMERVIPALVARGYRLVTISELLGKTEPGEVYTQGPIGVPPTSVIVSPTTETLNVDMTKQLTATVSPSNASDKTITWTSNDTTVVTVSTTGLVTAKATGTATITAKTINALTASCTVTVNDSGKYTITYNGNDNTDGTNPIDKKLYNDTDVVTVLGPGNLAKAGHTFAGWSTKQDGSGTYCNIGKTFSIIDANIIDYVIDSNLTLYAQWA
jgi:uncharacterized repeat protein (TIGR02543 family)